MAFALSLFGGALAQAQAGDPVAWTAEASSATSVRPGETAAITVHGAVQGGWHVYALTQPDDGPTPLRVAVEANAVALADGAPTGSPPLKVHDPAFDQETQFYAQPFTVTVPVRVAAAAAAGRQLIPLSVRFQSCDGQICKPPKTVRLTAAVDVGAKG